MGWAHLDVDKHAMVGLIQHPAAPGMQRELEGDLRLAAGELPRLQHVDGAAEDLDGLSTQVVSQHERSAPAHPAHPLRGLRPQAHGGACCSVSAALCWLHMHGKAAQWRSFL